MADDQVIHDFGYDDAWYPSTDGGGFSLTIVNELLEPGKWSQAAGWMPSLMRGGTPGQAELAGDINGDSVVNAEDIDLLYQRVHDQLQDPAFDLTGDGLVDENDVEALVIDVIGTRQGDVDLNGAVDQVDFGVFASRFGKSPASWADGDFDGDNRIGFSDFNLLSNNFGFRS